MFIIGTAAKAAVPFYAISRQVAAVFVRADIWRPTVNRVGAIFPLLDYRVLFHVFLEKCCFPCFIDSIMCSMMLQSEDTIIRHTYDRFLIPTIFALLGTTFSSFGNTLLAGAFLGKEVLSAMNILSSFTFLFALFGCLISIGAASRSSIALGRQDYETAGKYEWLSLVLSFLVPLIVSFICLISFKGLFTLLGADEETFFIGETYGRLVIAFGFLNTLMYFPFNYLRMTGKGRYGMYAFSAMGIVDIVLVYTFLKLGMGPEGVALGYIISMAVADVSGIFFLLKENTLFKMKRPRIAEIPFMLGTITSFGGASALNNLCKLLRTVSLNLLVAAYLGKAGLQSLAVGCSIINLSSASVTGFGQAVSPIIGVLFGEWDRKGQRQAVRVSVTYALFFHVILALLIFPFAPAISSAFGISDSEHIRQTALLLRLIAISLIPSAIMNVLIYYYTAIGQNGFSMILTVMHAFLFVVAISALHLRFDPSNRYGAAFIVAELADFALMALLGVLKSKRDPNLEGILLERKVFAEKFFSTVSDGTREGAVEASDRVVSFCEENDVSPALCMKLPLVVEELIVVLALHCFSDSSSKVDIRISLVEEKVLLRMRCEGNAFNPIEWYLEKKRRLSPEELMEDESIGMNVVEKLSNDVNYTRMFDVNNLIVSMGKSNRA